MVESFSGFISNGFYDSGPLKQTKFRRSLPSSFPSFAVHPTPMSSPPHDDEEQQSLLRKQSNPASADKVKSNPPPFTFPDLPEKEGESIVSTSVDVVCCCRPGSDDAAGCFEGSLVLTLCCFVHFPSVPFFV